MFRLIDGCVGSGVDDQVGTHLIKRGGQLSRLAEVKSGPVGSDHLAERLQGLAQGTAYLSTDASQQNAQLNPRVARKPDNVCQPWRLLVSG